MPPSVQCSSWWQVEGGWDIDMSDSNFKAASGCCGALSMQVDRRNSEEHKLVNKMLIQALLS